MMCKRLTKPLGVFLVLGLLVSCVDADVVAYWQFDEGAGTIAKDGSGNGHDGTLENGAEWTDGEFGDAVQFDGADDYVNVGNADDFSITGDFTFSMWVKISEYPTAWRNMLSKLVDDQHAEFNFRYKTSTQGQFYHGTGSAAIVCAWDPSADLPLDTWTHIAGVRKSKTYLKLYFNGVEKRTLDITTDAAATEANVTMGRQSNAVFYFNGTIDEVAIFAEALGEAEIQSLMSGLGHKELASKPNPTNEAVDVPRDAPLVWEPGEFAAKHDVYFGMVFDDVANASAANPLDVLVSPGQTGGTYDVGILDFGKTYYWRVDEVNDAPDNTVFTGDVWSFEVEPVSYAVPMEAVSATASSTTDGQDPHNTVNGLGLNDNDEHSTLQEHMWLAEATDVTASIQFVFDKLLKLDKVHVWNHNTQTESILGFGIKEALIEYSVDSETWSELGTVELSQASSATTYKGEDIDLGGILAKVVKITGLSNHSIIGLPQKGLAEVRFYDIPVKAREPMPADGSTTDDVDVVMNWRAGREAVEHEVVFSDDPEAVNDGSAVVATVSDPSYDLGTLTLGTAYFWKINEMNDLGTPPAYEGDLWSFLTPDHIMLDDMEMYKAEEGLFIWEHWIDGFDNPGDNGAVVGDGDNAEKTIVFEGSQSLPMAFDNTVAAMSEATRYFDTALDLTDGNPESLKLQVRGDAVGFIENVEGTFTVGAAGVDIWNTADDFRFVYKRLSGDGSITARIDSCTQANVWTKAGIMIRENLSADATNSYSFVTPTGRVGTQWRDITFGATVATRSETEGEIALPYWVRLTRTGSLFKGEQSADGVTWQPMFQSGTPDLPTAMEVFMIPEAYIGMAVTSHQAGVSASAIFSNVSTTGNVTGSWISEAIGEDNHPGNDAAPIYIRLADTSGKEKTFDHPNPQATILTAWDEWTIPIADLSPVNPAKLDSITIGISGAGVEGKLFIDAIQTHKAYPAATE